MAASIQITKQVYVGDTGSMRIVLTTVNASGLPKEIFVFSGGLLDTGFMAVASADQLQNLTTVSTDEFYRGSQIDLTFANPALVDDFLLELSFDVKLLLKDVDALDTNLESTETLSFP